MVWAFKSELQLVLHEDEYIKSQKEMEMRRQLWTDHEPAMPCYKPSLTLQLRNAGLMCSSYHARHQSAESSPAHNVVSHTVPIKCPPLIR